MAKDGGEVKIRQAHSQYLETCMTCMTPAIDEYGFARVSDGHSIFRFYIFQFTS